MGRRTLLNLALAVVVAALALVVWLEPGIEEAPPPPTLTTVAASSVDRITIDYPERDSVALERRDGQWHMTAPYQLPANDYKVGTLLDLLGAASHGTLDTADLDLGRFGLAPPKAVVRLGATELAFGDTEPIDGYRYVRHGDRVHLVTDRFFYQLNTGATGFVSYQLLGPGIQPAAIHLGELRAARADTGWTVSPADEALAADAGERLAAAWRNARGVAVKPHPGTGEAQQEVTITPAGGKTTITFRVFREDGDVLFVRPDQGVAYVVPEDTAGRLLEPPAAAKEEEGAGDGAPPATTDRGS